MANIFSPNIDSEELANRIRAEIGTRRLSATDSPKTNDPIALPRVYEFPTTIVIKESYSIADFLDFQDGDFIRNAYLAILKREADVEGFKYYLSKLRGGAVTRIEILGRLRYSSEGRKHGVPIAGLWHQTIIRMVFRIPILGYFLTLINFFCQLPSLLRKLRLFEAIFYQRLQEHRVQFNELARRAEDSFDWIAGEASRIGIDISDIRQQILSKADDAELATLRSQIGNQLSQKADAEQVSNELSEIWKQVIDHKHNIIDQQRRLGMLLEEARKRLPKPARQDLTETLATEEDRLFDALHVSLEDHFRGTRKDIKKRLQPHLPIVIEAQAGTAEAPILDIGCGRGEWLEVLSENGLVAKGIDTNRVMIDRCHEFLESDLDAIEAEAVTYLRSLKPNSLGAVTGFNLLEHIPFRNLVNILDEVLRVLKPGGVAIFASPDPENKGHDVWHLYQAHRSLFPPPMIQYLAEARGFVRVKIEHQGEDMTALHQSRKDCTITANSAIKLPSGSHVIVESSYSVIAYKV